MLRWISRHNCQAVTMIHNETNSPRCMYFQLNKLLYKDLTYSVPLTEEEIFAQVMAAVNRELQETMRMSTRKRKSLGNSVTRRLIGKTIYSSIYIHLRSVLDYMMVHTPCPCVFLVYQA